MNKTTETKDEQGLKIFLLAYANDPQENPAFNAWTKKQIRTYREHVLMEAENKRATNPMAIQILRGITSIPLADLGKVMFSMKRIYDELENAHE